VNEPLLTVEAVTVAYDRFVAVEDASLVVPEGSIVALLGPNGAGKSTLLKAIAGLVPCRSGSIRLGDRALDTLPAHTRAALGICLIPEGRGIFPNLTVTDNLFLALGRDDAAVQRVEEFFPVLAQRRQQLAGTLSGGEQQMLALARAVGADPTLLLTDELSLGLAPILVATITETLERLHAERGRTILLVEQYATHALRIADLVYILNHGQLVWAGEPAEVRSSRVLVESYLG